VSRPVSGAHPASYPMGTGGPFPGSKSRPGNDSDHSPPSSAEVNNEQEVYNSPPRCLHDDSGTHLLYRPKLKPPDKVMFGTLPINRNRWIDFHYGTSRHNLSITHYFHEFLEKDKHTKVRENSNNNDDYVLR
jgi:hypothetical protein